MIHVGRQSRRADAFVLYGSRSCEMTRRGQTNIVQDHLALAGCKTIYAMNHMGHSSCLPIQHVSAGLNLKTITASNSARVRVASTVEWSPDINSLETTDETRLD